MGKIGPEKSAQVLRLRNRIAGQDSHAALAPEPAKALRILRLAYAAITIEIMTGGETAIGRRAVAIGQAMTRLGDAALQGQKREVIGVMVDTLQQEDIRGVVRDDLGHRIRLRIAAPQIPEQNPRPGTREFDIPCGETQRVSLCPARPKERAEPKDEGSD